MLVSWDAGTLTRLNRWNFAGPNLDKNRVQLLDLGPFYENHTKLYFDAKHLKMDAMQCNGSLFSRNSTTLNNKIFLF